MENESLSSPSGENIRGDVVVDQNEPKNDCRKVYDDGGTGMNRVDESFL
jgi:hypothetical protein